MMGLIHITFLKIVIQNFVIFSKKVVSWIKNFLSGGKSIFLKMLRDEVFQFEFNRFQTFKISFIIDAVIDMYLL